METIEKNQKATRYTLLTLLLLSFIGNFYFFMGNKTLGKERDLAVLHSDSLLASKLNGDKQINSLSDDLLSCEHKSSELDSLVKTLNTELEAKKAEIKRLANKNGGSGITKKQLKDALKQNAVCNEQVNKLLKEVATLEDKVKELTNTIGSIKADNEDLKSKLDKAKSLKAYDVVVTNFKNTKTTQKAKRTNRINVVYLLPENELAEAGSKEVNVLIYNPQGKVISPKGNKFLNKTLQKEQVYSVNKTVNYNNQDTKSSVDFECNCKLDKGKYKTEIYIDGKLAGKKEFELK